MSKYVDANDKILYNWARFQIPTTACHLKKYETRIANLFIVQLQFHLL